MHDCKRLFLFLEKMLVNDVVYAEPTKVKDAGHMLLLSKYQLLIMILNFSHD